MKFYPLCLAFLITAGCATPPSQQEANKPPRHAGRVVVLMYDSTPRAKSDRVDVFDGTREILKPTKDIALLTCEGTYREEVAMTEALIYRARMMGADAVLLLPSNNYVRGGPAEFGGGSGRKVYRAKALVYEILNKQ